MLCDLYSVETSKVCSVKVRDLRTGLESVGALPKVMATKWHGQLSGLGLSDYQVILGSFRLSSDSAIEFPTLNFGFCGVPSDGTTRATKKKCSWLVLTLIWSIWRVVEARLMH